MLELDHVFMINFLKNKKTIRLFTLYFDFLSFFFGVIGIICGFLSLIYIDNINKALVFTIICIVFDCLSAICAFFAFFLSFIIIKKIYQKKIL